MSSNKYWYNSQYNMHEKGSSQHITIAVFSSLRTHLKKCASLANQDRKNLQDKPIIANVGKKKVYFQQKAWVHVNMRPVLYNSMFEFIINDGQDSTTLNWRSIQCSIQSSGTEQLWSPLNLLSFSYIEPLIKTKPLD